MEETLKMMKIIIEGYETTKSLEQLIQEYQKSQNTDILAYVFVKNYGLIKRISYKYIQLDTQDIASYCLQELDNAMKKFDAQRHCSFITFFYSCFENRLRLEANKLKKYDEVVNYLIEDLPEYEEIVDTKFTFDSLSDFNLNKPYQELCNYILEGYSCPEIAKLLNISHSTVYNRLKKIGNILLN